MDLDRRTLLRRGGVVGTLGLAGCSGGGGTGAPTRTPTDTATGTPTAEPTPSPTPACGDDTYRDVIGEFSFEYGMKTVQDETRYDGTLRIYHVRTPPCQFEGVTPTGGECGEASEELLLEEEYRVTDNLTYDILTVSVTPDIDSFRLEWAAAGGTDVKYAVEEAARHLVDTFQYDFFVCDPGARRLGFVVADGKPRIVRSPTAESA